MYPFRYIISAVALALQSYAIALDSGEIAAVLDVEGLQFSIRETDGSVTVETAVSHVGGSCLAFSVKESVDPQFAPIDLEMDVLNASGPGMLTFWVRATGMTPSWIRVNESFVSWLVEGEVQTEVWFPVRYYLDGSETSVKISMIEDRALKGARFYLDGFDYKPGMQFEIRGIAEAGVVERNPEKSLYEFGELVAVAVRANSGYRIASVAEQNVRTAAETVLDPVFKVTMDRHFRLLVGYEQLVDFPRLSAWSPLDDASLSPAADGSYSVRSLSIDNVPAGSLLSFAADMNEGGVIEVKGAVATYLQDKSFEYASPVEGYVNYDAMITDDEENLQIIYTSRSKWSYPEFVSIKDLELTQELVVKASTVGSGEVTVSYEPGPSDGERIAKVVATPADGWEFRRWTGVAESRNSELSLLLDAPVTLVAEFAQVFHLGDSKWSFVHDGSVVIEERAETQNFRIRSVDSIESVSLEVAVNREGLFGAKSRYIALDGQSETWPADLFPDSWSSAPSTYVDVAPRRFTKDLRVEPDRYLEIYNIVVAGGTSVADIAFSVGGAPGSVLVSPQKSSYTIGDLVSLSIHPDYRERFVAWSGDIYSAELDIQLVLDRPISVSPVFEQTHVPEVGRQVVARGSVMLEPVSSDSHSFAFSTDSFPSEAWTELEFPVTAPMTVGIVPDFSNLDMEISYWQGNQRLPDSSIQSYGGVEFCTLDPLLEGPLRVIVQNDGAETTPYRIDVAGYYQKRNPDGYALNGISFGGGRVYVTPDDPFLLIGTEVDLLPEPDIGFLFSGWNYPSLGVADRKYIVSETEAYDISPRFEPNLGSSMVYAGDATVGWEIGSGPSFWSHEAFVPGEERSLVLDVQGPGVVAFDMLGLNNTPLGNSLAMTAEVDGFPVPVGDFLVDGLSSGWKVFVGEGLNRLTLSVRLSDEAIQEERVVSDVRIFNIEFRPGYIVGQLRTSGYGFLTKADAEAESHPPGRLFSPGTPVRITATVSPDKTFGGWIGDLEGKPETVDLVLDRHILTNPIESRTQSLGPIQAEISENAIYNSQIGGTYGSAYYIESESGPTTLVFQVPAMTELSFEFYNAIAPVRIQVDNELIYSGEPGNVPFAFPVKELPYSVTVLLDLDPSSDAQVWIQQIYARQAFRLSGDFGAQQKFVTAEPYKEEYLPGEKAQVIIGNDAPSEYVFSDVMAFYPTLGIVEWLKVEGQKSFELEIASDAVLKGTVGPSPVRLLGEVVLSDNLSLAASSFASPTGGSSKLGSIVDGDFAYLRIATGQQKHANFWLNAPLGQYWIFSDVFGNGEPLVIEGTGEWMQLSLPVAENSEYLNAFVGWVNSAATSFLLSEVALLPHYGVPFVSSGGGEVRMYPSEGVEQATDTLRLQAIPFDGYEFESWSAENSVSSSEIQVSPVGGELLLPFFKQGPRFLSFNGLRFQAIKAADLLASGNGVALSEDGAAVVFQFDGPGRFLFDGALTDGGTVLVKLNGVELRRYTAYEFLYGSADTEIRIPSGGNILEFVYSNESVSGRMEMTSFSYERGAYLDRPYVHNGTISVAPEKAFYQLGESVVLEAIPDWNYTHTGWLLNDRRIEGGSRYAFIVEEHTTVNAEFLYEEYHQHDALAWKVTGLSSGSGPSHATTDISGPGYLRITNADLWLGEPVFKLDGKDADVVDTGSEYIVLIPKGEHQFVYYKKGDASTVARRAQYIPGFAFVLYGDTELIQVEPSMQGYVEGASVRVDWKSGADSSLLHFINGSEVNGLLPLGYVADDHHVLKVERRRAVAGTSFLTNAALSDVAISKFQYGSTVAGGVSIDVTPSGNRENQLEAVFLESGRLSFQFLNPGVNRLEVCLNGALAYETMERDGTVSIKLPPEGALVQLNMVRDYSREPITIKDFLFEAGELASFEMRMSQVVPIEVFALSNALGPEDDLDGDGLDNAAELMSGSAPHLFTIPTEIGHSQSHIGELQLSFTLPVSVEVEDIQIQLLNNEHWVWEPWPLAIFPFEKTLIENGRYRYSVRIAEIDRFGSLFRVDLKNNY